MRIVLRNRKTRQYLQDGGRWTDDPQLALDFPQSRHAARLVQQTNLQNMEVVLSFENSRHNIRLRLRASA